MKKSKKLGLQSLALVLMSLVLVAGVAFGMTGAWFNDQKATGDETVVLGNGVYLEMAATGANYFVVTGKDHEGNEVTRSNDKVFPGDTINFSATINLADNSEAAMVRYKVTISGDIEASIDGYTNDAWTTPVYVTAADEAHVIALEVVLTGTAYDNDHAGDQLVIKVEVQATQAANYDEANFDHVASYEFTA